MSDSLALALRWLARLSALLVAAAFLLLIAGETLHPHSGPPTEFVEWLGISLLAAAVVGMVLAWIWELPGALVSLACLSAFVAIVRMRDFAWIAVVAAPGLLFLADWLYRRFLHAPAASSR